MDRKVEIDYLALQLEAGDLFLLATDGVYEFRCRRSLRAAIAAAPDLDAGRAGSSPRKPCARGSGDNLTVQMVRIDELPSPEANELYRQVSDLPCPPLLEARDSSTATRSSASSRAAPQPHLPRGRQDSGERW
jgi:hypothetical protein